MPKVPRTGVSSKSKQVPKDPRIPKGADYKRSIYYDPILNPYGAPPPAPTPDPYAVDTKTSRSTLDKIEMPKSKSPADTTAAESKHNNGLQNDGDDDDDIVMPSGPPPPHARIASMMPIVQPRTTAPQSQTQTVEAITYEQPAVTAPDNSASPKDAESSITMSSAPQLRIQQHDSTAFIPTSLRQRQQRAKPPFPRSR